ncbi:MAG TPA: trigger factor [Acidimicrobiales bacterium]|jgi:trigger factor|nr:trigger factor [Acidimicrobiales bacterium]
MRASAAPVEGNKVRLSVEIDEVEIDEALDGVMNRLAREVRVPGFRPGKVPRRVIEARMGGATALRGEALREALPGFYARAVSDTEVDPIDQPEIDITSGDESGAVSFDAVVQVRPTVAVPGYRGLSVTLPSLEVTEEEVNTHLDRLRATSGQLVEVSRPAKDGDQVTIDIHGSRIGPGAGGEDDDLDAQDFLYEVGSGSVVPALDDQLRGSKVGDILSFQTEAGAEGQAFSFRVLVKETKELLLPEVTDEWAAEASEFDTVEELTDDLRVRLRQQHVARARVALEQRTADALAELVTEEIPDQLVAAELRERIHDLTHRLESQGMDLGQFLAATGRDERQFVDELRTGALEGVKIDLALRTVVEEEGIEVTDEELDAELATMGERLEMDVDEVREQLEQGGRLAAVRSDRRKAKAMRWLVDNVELVDEDGQPVSRDELTVEPEEEGSE